VAAAYLRGGGRRYLFDLDKDAEEKHNLLEQYPDVASRLDAKLVQWTGQLQPPGMQEGAMGPAQDAYYDFYLDGKPAPPRRPANAGRASAGRTPRDRAVVFKARDKDHDGQLTLEELIGDPAHRNVPALTRMFKSRDKDKDQRVSRDEFVRNR